MNAKNSRGLASVIVPCWSQLEFTRQCIAALKSHTRPPWELIVIDNGSTDHTGIYLAGVRDGAAVPVTVISNPTNRGFPAAINQGLKAARGEYLVLLNNDVVVTDGWLDQLVALANAKRLSTAEHAEHGEIEAEELGAGSGDPRTARHADELGAGSGDAGMAPSVPDAGDEMDPVAAVPPGTEIRRVSGGVRPTPPGPPFARGGKVLVPPSVDSAGAGVEDGETSAAPSSLPTAGCLLPTVRSIGLVGPMSNYAAPPQLVENVPYQDLRAMHGFARRWRDEHRGKWFAVRKLSGFCLLMKRAVYDKIGGLDERFGIGFFDDDDLAERARRAGFELAVARDLFVHHFGSRTFRGNGVDAEKLLEENARRFADKWGLAEANGRRVSLRPFVDSSLPIADSRNEAPDSEFEISESSSTDAGRSRDSALLSSSPARRATVSLTMIVRDEQDNLPHCLASVRGVFDEIVVVDTGSVDRTKEIAREFGAKVFDFVWIDDFAAARNEALAHATGDYAFWLDADDVVEPWEREKLQALLGRLAVPSVRSEVSVARMDPRPPEDCPAAYVVRCACAPGPNGSGGETVVDHVRLFPICPGVRWTYRVHEQILPSLKRAKVPVRWTDLTVRHTGYVDRALRARKLDRDMRILERELEERPDEPFVLFNLGAIAVERREWHEALGFLERSLARSAPADSIVRKLYALIARAHQMTGQSQEALRTCAEGLKLDPEDAELWHRKGVVHRHRGESAEAEECWRRILNLKRPDQFCSVDQGIYGHVTRRNLRPPDLRRGWVDGR